MKQGCIKNRRGFLGQVATIGAGVMILPGCSTPYQENKKSVEYIHPLKNSELPHDVPKPCSPDAWVKHGVIIEPEYDKGQKFIQNFNSPAEPLGDGRWRVWHGVNPPKPGLPNIAFSEGVPGEEMFSFPADLSEKEPSNSRLSIGNLPEGWRPVQPVHIRLANGRDRLYFWVHCPSQRIVRLLAADSSDGMRYKVVDPHRPCMYHFRDRAVEFEGVTPSGLSLKGKTPEERTMFPRPSHEPQALPELICNDGTSIYQLSDGSFEMYVISLLSLEKGDPRWAANDNLAGYIRVIDRLVSKDGLNWNDRKTVVKPDPELDPHDQQFYYLNVTHTSKGRIGMLGHYKARDQTMDVEWCFSKDGIHWERPYRNRPWIPRGWPGSPDCLAIYPGTSLVFDQDKWWLFYTGCNYTHNRQLSHGEPRSVVMLAQTKSLWSS